MFLVVATKISSCHLFKLFLVLPSSSYNSSGLNIFSFPYIIFLFRYFLLRH
ncbi:unnamed protein product [Moneuplotes crassus]|uniref:Uncharacterized protein n=1 Tax=Euplotes crassus TaxID=5936 RepID=A0AAD1XM38_EUPCR|nr:unnamed protein product [Moneuplotes crassus]